MLLGVLKEKCISRRTVRFVKTLATARRLVYNKIFKSLTAGITANDVQIPLDMGGTQSRALKKSKINIFIYTLITLLSYKAEVLAAQQVWSHFSI